MHRNIKILLISSTSLHSALLMLEPFFAMWMKTIDGQLYQSGIALLIFYVSKGAGFFIVERYAGTRISRKCMINIGYLLFTIGHALYLLASKPAHVMYIQIVIAIATVVIMPSWDAIRAIYITQRAERSIFARFNGYRSLFEGVGVFIGALIAQSYGFYALFVLMTLLSLFATICSLYIVDDRPQ